LAKPVDLALGSELYIILDGEVEVEAQGVRLGYLSEGLPARYDAPGDDYPQKIAAGTQSLAFLIHFQIAAPKNVAHFSKRTHSNHGMRGHFFWRSL
jgi:hypothetical protein